MENTAEQFGLESNLVELKQGDMDVTQYYNKLSWYWQQLDTFEELEWECVANCRKYKMIAEKNWILAFLNGLDKNLDAV